MKHQHDQPLSPHPPLRDYLPLAIIITFILVCTGLVMYHTRTNLPNFLSYSMGFFFLFFAMFKLLDLRGFAHGYHEYDLIAKRFFAWGLVYPFVELGLGVAYVAGIDNLGLHLFTVALTTLAVCSVYLKMKKREIVQCACLGTVLKVPLTIVSLVEYGLMGLMAVIMIWL